MSTVQRNRRNCFALVAGKYFEALFYWRAFLWGGVRDYIFLKDVISGASTLLFGIQIKPTIII
jgi:hypothetical protein